MFLKDSDIWVCSWSSDMHINKQTAATIIKNPRLLLTPKNPRSCVGKKKNLLWFITQFSSEQHVRVIIMQTIKYESN